MIDKRTIRAISIVLMAVVLTNCSSLDPISLPSEYTPAAADAPLWRAVNDTRADDWLVLLDTGVNALDWRLTAIDSATDSIELQTFLWNWDLVGSLVMDHLVDAANRGVRIRLLVDDSFLLREGVESIALNQHPNIDYRVFNPFKRESDSAIWRQILNVGEFHRLDHRMHNKAMLVDSQVAIVGGRNLGDEYFGIHDDANFRDLELLVGGPIVLKLADEFDKYWNDDWSFPVEMLDFDDVSPPDLDSLLKARQDAAGIHKELDSTERRERWLTAVKFAHAGEPALYFDQPPEDDPNSTTSQPVQLAAKLIEILDGAEEEILIVSPYLIPTTELQAAVERAVRRGVAVRMLTNSIRSNNHLAAHSAYRKHIDDLISAGASMHEVRVDARDRSLYMLTPVEQKELALHAKALVIDNDRILIGSTNLDPRSLRINTEMGLLVRSNTLNTALRAAIERDFLLENAWQLRFSEDGQVQWVSDQLVLDEQPAASFMQRLEDWFLSHLPIENEM